ncbi:MAG: GxGYxYP domain-containing protein [Anaerohalosphaeraceae bacterium]
MFVTKTCRRIAFVVVFLTCGSLLAAAWDTTVNYVTSNPGFEAGTTGWYTARGVLDNTIYSEGTQSGKLSAPGGEHCDWRSQGYASIEEGKKYQLIFDYRTSAGAAGQPQMRFRFFGSDGFKGEAQMTLERTEGIWQTVTMPYTCPAGTTYFDIFYTLNTFGSFTGTAWLDKVAVYSEIIDNPEPDFSPADGTMGWSDELTLQWPANAEASSYRVYLGTAFDEVDSAEAVFLPGDFDLNAAVNIADFVILADQWISGAPPIPGPVADINGDQAVDLADFESIASHFNQSSVLPPAFKDSTYAPSLKVKLPGMAQDYYWRIDAVVEGQPQEGTIRQFNSEDYLDYAIAAPQHIYYIDQSALTRTEQVLFQSLQGLVARQRPALFIRNSSNALWLNDLASRYGVSRSSIAAISGSIDPLDWTLDHYTGYYDSYILCDAYGDPASLTAAVSLAAAVSKALVVDIADESLMTGRGKTKLADMRGLDEKWVWDNYKDRFTKKAIFVQRDDITTHGAYLRDLPIALGALTWWHSNLAATEEVFSAFRPNIPCYGWDSSVRPGEDNAVTFHSQHSMYTAVTDWMLNLSLYAGMASREPEIQFTQPCSDNRYTPEDNVHYVAFCMSDMDNTNTVFSADGWAQHADRYGNSHRGQFAMGWGMPPIMMKIGPTVMKWWYDHATEKDCFIGYCSGLDYFHPTQFPALDIHMSHLDKYLRRADLSTLCILDNTEGGLLTSETYRVGHLYASLESLRGFFMAYDQYKGKILWFDGKPMVTARYALWNSTSRKGVSSTGQELAASINAQPADPDSENGYTFVIIHAWSYGWDEAAACIDLLDSDVRVVTPNELIEQLYLHNVGTQNSH